MYYSIIFTIYQCKLWDAYFEHLLEVQCLFVRIDHQNVCLFCALCDNAFLFCPLPFSSLFLVMSCWLLVWGVLWMESDLFLWWCWHIFLWLCLLVFQCLCYILCATPVLPQGGEGLNVIVVCVFLMGVGFQGVLLGSCCHCSLKICQNDMVMMNSVSFWLLCLN